MADTSAPNYDLEIDGTFIGDGVRQMIQKVEYESADGMADVARIHCVNPEFALTDAKTFAPGNEMSLYMGYGQALKHIGRVIIAKQRPEFPEEGMPKLVVIGYTKDHKMMDNAPEKSKAAAGKHGRIHKNKKYSEAVEEIAQSQYYKMTPDVDATPESPLEFVHKVGLKDFDFIQGLSNITGFIFWVDADSSGEWKLHFKDPEKLNEQEKKRKFYYNLGDMSSLLSFKPELLIRDLETKIKVQAKNTKTGKLIEFEVEESNDGSPDVQAKGNVTGKLDKGYTTASDIKLFIGDFSFDLVGNRKFKDAADAQSWAKQWFRRNREQFILASGRTIGVEDLMARQTHALEGLGIAYDGDYYFTKVKHVIDITDGYVCEIAARKVVPPVV